MCQTHKNYQEENRFNLTSSGKFEQSCGKTTLINKKNSANLPRRQFDCKMVISFYNRIKMTVLHSF